MNGKVDPVDDSDVINFELALADISQIERRMERLNKKAKSKEEATQQEVHGRDFPVSHASKASHRLEKFNCLHHACHGSMCALDKDSHEPMTISAILCIALYVAQASSTCISGCL